MEPPLSGCLKNVLILYKHCIQHIARDSNLSLICIPIFCLGVLPQPSILFHLFPFYLGSGYFAGPDKIAPRSYFAGSGKIVPRSYFAGPGKIAMLDL